jgi:hypothetical protein
MTTTVSGARVPQLRRIQPMGSAAAVTQFVKTQWPRIGGRYLKALPENAFLETAFASRYEPGFLTSVYLGACGTAFGDHTGTTGLIGVARRLNLPLYKISVTQAADPRIRLQQLNRDRYASTVVGIDGVYGEEDGFQQWTFQQFQPERTPLSGSPVIDQGRFFTVRRPADMEKDAFDKLLHVRLRAASFNAFIQSHAGEAHCAALGRKAEHEVRYTRYRFAETPRIDPAQELYIFRPAGEDSDRLLTIIETLIYDWVTGKIARQPAWWRDPGQRSRRGDRPPVAISS